VTRLATEAVESSQEPEPRRRLAWLIGPQALTMYLYVLGGFFVTLRLWQDPVWRRQYGDIQDVNQATWFVRYTADAVEHFRLPALTTPLMNAPHTVNLMWNTSLLLPGMVVAPVTWAFGPQVALTTLLVIGFAGSAASMYYVLRRWDASLWAAALGGTIYGFSPALVYSGIGHYSLVIAIIPPLMLDRLMRIVTGRGSALKNGIWLGLLASAQLFVSEEALVDAVIAAGIMLVVLALSRPREVLKTIRPLVVGAGTAAAIAVVLCGRALWVQFHGVAAKGAAATVIIQYNGHLTNLGTLPYAFITPGSGLLLHSSGSAYSINRYPQPLPEYLAYLGVPMIILLIWAIIYFWKNPVIRVAGLTCVLLEWLGLGAQPISTVRPFVTQLPKFLLPWGFIDHLPVIGGMVPDRLCILADAAAAVVLARALDLARSGAVPWFARRPNGAKLALAGAVIAILPMLPAPYTFADVNPLPPGYTATFKALDLKPSTRVLMAPFPYSGQSQMMRFQADTGYPVTMIGGDFIAPDEPGRLGRAGRSALTPTTRYINYLTGDAPWAKPSAAQIRADLAAMQPQAVVAVTNSEQTSLSKFLIMLFGPPQVHFGHVYGWRLTPGTGYLSG
jgi:hypothetical protein